MSRRRSAPPCGQLRSTACRPSSSDQLAVGTPTRTRASGRRVGARARKPAGDVRHRRFVPDDEQRADVVGHRLQGLQQVAGTRVVDGLDERAPPAWHRGSTGASSHVWRVRTLDEQSTRSGTISAAASEAPTRAAWRRPTSDSGLWMSSIRSGCSAFAWRSRIRFREPWSGVTGSESHHPEVLRSVLTVTGPSRGRRRRRARSRRWWPGTSRRAGPPPRGRSAPGR